MKVGFVGLGKMGSQMVARLLSDRHIVVAYDVNPAAVGRAAQSGAVPAADRHDMIARLGEKPVIWLMIPAAFVDQELAALVPLLPKGSIVVDGGNSDYRHTLQRAGHCREKGIELVDVGTSGGILGLHEGFAMMVGGGTAAVRTVEPLLKSLSRAQGYHHFGPTGSGHFIKMVHNAIEYGVMESYAEGYQLLKEGPFTGLDLAAVARVWQNGSIIASNINKLSAQVLAANPELSQVDGYVAQTGEATWALETAQERGIATPAIQAAVTVRQASQKGQVSFATKLLAALRNAFGGHPLNKL